MLSTSGVVVRRLRTFRFSIPLCFAVLRLGLSTPPGLATRYSSSSRSFVFLGTVARRLGTSRTYSSIPSYSLVLSYFLILHTSRSFASPGVEKRRLNTSRRGSATSLYLQSFRYWSSSSLAVPRYLQILQRNLIVSSKKSVVEISTWSKQEKGQSGV